MTVRRALLLGCSLLITSVLLWGAGELYFRINQSYMPTTYVAGGNNPPHLVRTDPSLGYALTPNFTGRQIHYRGDFNVEVRTNRDGLRDVDRNFPRKGRGVIVVGDSMTFGEGVAFEETWAYLLERHLQSLGSDIYVVKAGVPGYGIHQMQKQYQKWADIIGDHTLVIVGFLTSETSRIHRGYEVKGGILVLRDYPNLVVLDGYVYEKISENELVNQLDLFLRRRSLFSRWLHQGITRAIKKLERSRASEEGVSSPAQPVAHRHHVVDAIRHLKSIQKITKRHKARMLVLMIWGSKTAEETAYYQAVFSKEGIPYIDLSELEEDHWYFPHDFHYNALGHAEIARTLYREILERGWMTSVQK